MDLMCCSSILNVSEVYLELSQKSAMELLYENSG